MKYENLIPYNEYKIKNLALSNLFSLQFKPNTVYAVKLIDICRLIETYFTTLNKYYVDKCLDGFQMMNTLDDIFQTADHYFNSFTELHLVTNYVFYKENKCFKKYPVIYSDDQFDATINLIKERMTKTIIIDKGIRKKEYLFEQKYKKTINDILLELNLHQDYKIDGGDYVFENMKKINLQDFILYIAILRNILSL